MLRALYGATHPPSQTKSHHPGKPLRVREWNHITDRGDDLRPGLEPGGMERQWNRAVEEIDPVPSELGGQYSGAVDELPVGDEDLPRQPRPRQPETPCSPELDQIDIVRGMGAERVDERLTISRRSRVIEASR
jgi:hypothetical protein